MKTVRQLSEQLGIAKQSVDYHVKKLNESYIKEGNVNMIDDRLEQLIIDRVNNNRQQTTDEQQQASDNVEDKEDTNKNTTNESNNDDEYIQHLKDEVVYLRESLKHNQQLLDQQQQLSIHLQNKLDKLNAKPNTNEDNTRSVINSESNQSDNPIEESNSVDNRSIKVKKYKMYSPTDESTNEDVEDTKESDTDMATESTDNNIEDVKEADKTNVQEDTVKPNQSNKRKPWWKLW